MSSGKGSDKKITIKTAIPDGWTEEQAKLLQKASPIVNQQVGGDFSKVATNERRQILFRATPHARQPSMLWTKDRKLTKRFFVRRYLEYLDSLECEFTDRASRVLGQVDEELDLAGGNDIYLNLRSEESTLFFHVPRREISSREGMLIVKLPKDVYEVQRRAQLRYRVSESDAFLVRSEIFSLWLEDLRVLDVSSGGIGVLIRFPSEESASRFKLAAEERIHFHLDLEVFSFLVNGEVRYVRLEKDPESGLPSARIGIRFVGLTQDVVEAIQLFVMERSYVRLRELFTD